MHKSFRQPGSAGAQIVSAADDAAGRIAFILGGREPLFGLGDCPLCGSFEAVWSIAGGLASEQASPFRRSVQFPAMTGKLSGQALFGGACDGDLTEPRPGRSDGNVIEQIERDRGEAADQRAAIFGIPAEPPSDSVEGRVAAIPRSEIDLQQDRGKEEDVGNQSEAHGRVGRRV